MGLFGSDDNGSMRHQLDRIEAMLIAVIDHLGIDFDPDATGAFGMSEEVRALARAGRQIEAIKLLREQTGAGLAEAKDLVDRATRG